MLEGMRQTEELTLGTYYEAGPKDNTRYTLFGQVLDEVHDDHDDPGWFLVAFLGVVLDVDRSCVWFRIPGYATVQVWEP